MTQSSDSKLVEFLANERNVGCVLEVLKHGEAIRTTLSKRFWSALSTHLAKTAPSSLGKKLKWEFSSELPGTRGYCAWLDANFAQFRERPQSLFYRIEYYSWPQGLDLYYGLHWTAQTRPSEKILSTPALQNLRQRLAKDEYDLTEPGWWCGWRYVRRFSSPDDFLAFSVENPKFLFKTISDGIWPFVERTIKHVEKVNGSLKA